jgi:hypothetical protein
MTLQLLNLLLRPLTILIKLLKYRSLRLQKSPNISLLKTELSHNSLTLPYNPQRLTIPNIKISNFFTKTNSLSNQIVLGMR